MRNKYLRTGIALLLIVLLLLVASCGKTTAPVTSGPATFSQIRADIDQLLIFGQQHVVSIGGNGSAVDTNP